MQTTSCTGCCGCCNSNPRDESAIISLLGPAMPSDTWSSQSVPDSPKTWSNDVPCPTPQLPAPRLSIVESCRPSSVSFKFLKFCKAFKRQLCVAIWSLGSYHLPRPPPVPPQRRRVADNLLIQRVWSGHKVAAKACGLNLEEPNNELFISRRCPRRLIRISDIDMKPNQGMWTHSMFGYLGRLSCDDHRRSWDVPRFALTPSYGCHRVAGVPRTARLGGQLSGTSAGRETVSFSFWGWLLAL